MKISIIGLGAVGSAAASALIYAKLPSELLLCDIAPAAAQAAMQDLQDALALCGAECMVRTANAQECANSDVVVLSFTAGIAKSRPAELAANLEQLQNIAAKMSGFKGILLVATNPNDAIVYHARRLFNLPASRVIGTGTSLDSARLVGRIARDLNVAHTSVDAYMLGEHGDSQLAYFSGAKVAGVGICEAYEQAKVPFDAEQIEQFTAHRGHDIFNLKGKTEYGIASAITRIVRAIAHNEKALIAASSCIDAQIINARLQPAVPNDAALQAYSRLLIIGARGILGAVCLELSSSECEKLERSIKFIRSMCE